MWAAPDYFFICCPILIVVFGNLICMIEVFTFNCRNMHPVYVSLGNIHVDFRYQPYFDTLNMIKIFMTRTQPSGKRLFGFVPNIKVRSAFRNSIFTRRYRRRLMRESMAFIFQQLLEWPLNKTRNFALGPTGKS
jgi:hypothetical protein